MSKYDVLWAWIKDKGTDSFKLTFAEIEQITGFPIDHSFLTYKKRVDKLWVSGWKDFNEREDGFIRMSSSSKRVTLNRGYTSEGFADKVYHLHISQEGDNNELYFRYYLNDSPDVAKEYEILKLSLWKKYEHNRDEYTAANSEFVQKYTEKVKILYENRY